MYGNSSGQLPDCRAAGSTSALLFTFLALLFVVLTLGSPPAFAGTVTITQTSPKNGTTVSSPVTISATAKTTSGTIVLWGVYDNGTATKLTATGSTLNGSLTLSAGTHILTIRAWDSAGGSAITTTTITVSSSTSSSSGSSTSSGSSGSTSSSGSSSGTTSSSSSGSTSSSSSGSSSGSTTGPHVTITSPANNATEPASFTLNAFVSGVTGITGSKIYSDLNPTAVFGGNSTATSISAPLTLTAGTHNLTVKFWYNGGANTVSALLTVTVSGGGSSSGGSSSGGSSSGTGGVTIPSTAHYFRNAQDKKSGITSDVSLSGVTEWSNLTGASIGGELPGPGSTETTGLSVPTQDGGPNTTMIANTGNPKGIADWMATRKLIDATATHVVMSMWIQIDKPQDVDALEIAALKQDGSKWLKLSTQCNYRTGKFNAYDPKSGQTGWVDMGVPCVKAAAGKWQHLTFEFHTDHLNSYFDSITFDATKETIGKSLPGEDTGSGQALGVHFQTDALTGVGFKVYVDNWTLYYW